MSGKNSASTSRWTIVPVIYVQDLAPGLSDIANDPQGSDGSFGLGDINQSFYFSPAAAGPDGIDIYFENVGGRVWNAVFPLLNDFARIPVCGLVAHYSDVGPPAGPDRLVAFMRAVLAKRWTVQGFIVSDFDAQIDDFRRDVSAWLKAGKVKYREDIVEGLANAPMAFIGLLKGRNFGKLLVRVSK